MRDTYDLEYEAWRRGISPDEIRVWYEYERDPYDKAEDIWKDVDEIIDEFERDGER